MLTKQKNKLKVVLTLTEKEEIMNIRDFKKEELEAELERRKELRPSLLPMNMFDLEKIKEICEAVMINYDEKGYCKDAEGYIYEATLKALYGDDVFDWINENNEGC